MARDVESLVLQMSADLRKFEREMARSRQITERRMNDTEAAVRRANPKLARATEAAGRNMVASLRTSLSGLAPTIAAAFSTAQVVGYADAWTNGRNALAAAGVATEDLAARQERLVQIANDSRTGTSETIALYTRLSIATQELGLQSADTLRLTELLNKSFQASGASTQEAASAALQLSQALASGTLQGDELRSLRENAPQLAQIIAQSMGVGIGALKELGAEGKITGQVVAQAILGAGDAIEKKFDATQVTVSQALTKLNNSLGQYVGQADSGLSATDRMAQGIEGLANNLDSIVPVAVALASVMGGRFVLSLTAGSGAMIAQTVAAARLIQFQTAMTASMTGTTTASLAATAATRGFGAALAANPIGAAIIAVSALAAGVLYLANSQSEATITAKAQAKAHAEAQPATTALERLTRQLVNANDAETASIRSKIAALLDEQRVKAQMARNAYLEAKAAEGERTVVREQVRANPAFSNGAIPAGGLDLSGLFGRRPTQVTGSGLGPNGNPIDLVQDTAELRRLRAEADAAEQSYGRLRDTANEALNPTRSISSAVSDAKKGKGSGPSPEEIARARSELALVEEIARARAAGDEAAIQAAEERQELARLTRLYEAAGYADATARAMEQLGLQNEALRLTEEREATEARAQKIKDQANAADERAVGMQQLLAEQTRDRLGYEAELARISGNDGAIRTAERRLFIEERTLEILRLKLAATEAEARAMAGGEFDALDRAQTRRDVASDIVSVLRSDNIWEEAGRRFKDAAWDGVEDLLSQIFKSINFGGGGDGGLGSIIASMFGKRALGGPVRAGQPYIVGERRPEVFVPNTSGTIIPSVNAAMSRAQQAKAASGQPVIVQLSVDEGAMFAPRVAAISGDVSIRTTAAGVAFGQDQRKKDATRRRYSFIK